LSRAAVATAEANAAVAAGPRVTLTLAAVGAAAVVAAWWHTTRSIAGPGGLLTTLGEGLGLLAGYAVVIAVLLMARLPPVERGVGADRLARWHSTLGRWLVWVVSGHVLFIIWGYALAAHTGLVSETATLLTGYPDVLMATVGWFLMIAVGLTSLRAARRRLRYETWYYLHLYTYLAIALVFSHQFANGAAFSQDAASRLAWSALYIAAGALIVWYRLIVPASDFGRHRFVVAGLREEANRTVSVYIKGQRLGELGAAPGQFFRWRFLTRGLWWQSHPYSLSALPSDDLMRITVRDVGDPSNLLRSLRPGTRVLAEGPFGAFVPARSGRASLLLAGGVGITPLRAMMAALAGPVILVYRASSWQDVALRAELDSIAANRGAQVHYVIGSRSELGGDPLTADTLRSIAPGLDAMEAYVCGPPGMTAAAVAALRAAGAPRRRIHVESFEF
jgi:ferredoxin-NADP reductase/DMSO/TMAO reductase YedYZ heme-binding membrane subunit